jgi:hypothetical protein
VRLLVSTRTEAVEDDPDLDTLRDLPLEEPRHAHPDLSLALAEHQDVDR